MRKRTLPYRGKTNQFVQGLWSAGKSVHRARMSELGHEPTFGTLRGYVCYAAVSRHSAPSVGLAPPDARLGSGAPDHLKKRGQLWEIDENLMRAELSPTEMAEHLAKRKELWEARRVSVQPEPKSKVGRPVQFASDTADKTGVSKVTTRHHENDGWSGNTCAGSAFL